MAIWSIVDSGAATLRELETDYDYDDLLRLISYRTFKADTEEKISEHRKKQAEKNRGKN